MINIETQPLLTTQEVAEYLKVSAAAVKRWRDTGEGPPCIRVTSGVIRYRATDVEKFLVSRTAVQQNSAQAHVELERIPGEDDDAVIERAINTVDDPEPGDGWELSDDYSRSEVVQR